MIVWNTHFILNGIEIGSYKGITWRPVKGTTVMINDKLYKVIEYLSEEQVNPRKIKTVAQVEEVI